MQSNYHYDNASKAISELQAQGYDIDFNLESNRLSGPESRYNIEDFEVRDIYRYEGDSDPADEVIIYAIASGEGHKGIFMTAYGTTADQGAAEVLKRLKRAK